MAKIFRVENDEGAGPYSEHHYHWKNVDHSTETGRITPLRDGFACAYVPNLSKYHFGFSCLTKLKRWFTKVERERLSDIGFYMAIYETDSYIHSNSGVQTIFVKAKSQLVGALPLPV